MSLNPKPLPSQAQRYKINKPFTYTPMNLNPKPLPSQAQRYKINKPFTYTPISLNPKPLPVLKGQDMEAILLNHHSHLLPMNN